MSKVSNPIHLVINTKHRKMTLRQSEIESLYRYIWSQLSAVDCYLYRIGGIANHIHILFDLNPSHSLMEVVRDLKKNSSKWIKQSNCFPDFEGWGKEYFAFARSRESIDTVIEYIKNQPIHHSTTSFEDEITKLCTAHGIEWNDYLLT